MIGAQIASLSHRYLFMRNRTAAERRAVLAGDPMELAERAEQPGFTSVGSCWRLSVESLARFLPIPKSLPMDKFFNDATSAYMMAVFGILLAPLLEELFFRGMLYPDTAPGIGRACWRVLLTAAAFAAIHGAQLGYAWAPILSILWSALF